MAGAKLLIVDDQEFNITALKIFLRHSARLNSEIAIEEATSGQAAINLVRSNVIANGFKSCDYSIIFMDCNMPFMDGYQCTEEIRQMLASH